MYAKTALGYTNIDRLQNQRRNAEIDLDQKRKLIRNLTREIDRKENDGKPRHAPGATQSDAPR